MFKYWRRNANNINSIPVPLRLFKVWGFLGMMVQAPLFPLSLWVDKVRVMINYNYQYDEDSIQMEEKNQYHLIMKKDRHFNTTTTTKIWTWSLKVVKVFSIQGNGTEVWKCPCLAFSDSWSTFGGHDVLPRLCGRAFWQVILLRWVLAGEITKMGFGR